MSAFYSFCVPQDVAMGSGRSGVLAIISENCYLEGTFRDKYFSEEVGILTLKLLMSYIYIYIYMEHLFLMFLDHTQRRSTVGRTPLDE